MTLMASAHQGRRDAGASLSPPHQAAASQAAAASVHCAEHSNESADAPAQIPSLDLAAANTAGYHRELVNTPGTGEHHPSVQLTWDPDTYDQDAPRPGTPEPSGDCDDATYDSWGRKHFGEDWFHKRETMLRERNIYKVTHADKYRQRDLRAMERAIERRPDLPPIDWMGDLRRQTQDDGWKRIWARISKRLPIIVPPPASDAPPPREATPSNWSDSADADSRRSSSFGLEEELLDPEWQERQREHAEQEGKPKQQKRELRKQERERREQQQDLKWKECEIRDNGTERYELREFFSREEAIDKARNAREDRRARRKVREISAELQELAQDIANRAGSMGEEERRQKEQELEERKRRHGLLKAGWTPEEVASGEPERIEEENQKYREAQDDAADKRREANWERQAGLTKEELMEENLQRWIDEGLSRETQILYARQSGWDAGVARLEALLSREKLTEANLREFLGDQAIDNRVRSGDEFPSTVAPSAPPSAAAEIASANSSGDLMDVDVHQPTAATPPQPSIKDKTRKVLGGRIAKKKPTNTRGGTRTSPRPSPIPAVVSRPGPKAAAATRRAKTPQRTEGTRHSRRLAGHEPEFDMLPYTTKPQAEPNNTAPRPRARAAVPSQPPQGKAAAKTDKAKVAPASGAGRASRARKDEKALAGAAAPGAKPKGVSKSKPKTNPTPRVPPTQIRSMRTRKTAS